MLNENDFFFYKNIHFIEKYKKELKSSSQVAISVQTRVVTARAVDDQHLSTTISNFKINKDEERSFSWFMLSISGAHWALKKTDWGFQTKSEKQTF